MIRYLKVFFKTFFNPAVLIGAMVDNCSRIDRKARINRGVKVVNSVVGKYSYIGYRSCVVDSEIGNFCSIASDIQDVQSEVVGHALAFLSTSPILKEPHQKKDWKILGFNCSMRIFRNAGRRVA